MKSISDPNYRSEYVWLGLALLFSALIFGWLLHAPQLTWDDDSNIFGNPFFTENLWLPLWQRPYFGLYIPVTSTIWHLLYNLGKGEAWPFRLLNVGLHLANIYLAFVLLRGLCRRWNLAPIGLMVGTLIFALHPMQVHAVAWISGGRDLLATFFALAALVVYFGWVRPASFLLATALFLCSMLSKPTTAVLPLVIFGFDWIDLRRPGRTTTWQMAIWLCLGGAVAWLAHLAQEGDLPVKLSFFDHLWIVLDTYSFYLQKFVAPYPLTANYGRTPQIALLESTVTASVFMTIAVLSGFIFLSQRQDRRYLLILLWFVSLLPVSGLIPFNYQQISTVSDHYNYFPMLILAALTAFVLSRIGWDKVSPTVRNGLLAVLLLASAALSWQRTQSWTSDQNFFTDMAKYSPDSYSTALGMSIVMCEDLQQYEEGVSWTEKALKARPLDILALANQAFCFLHAKNYFRVIELEYYIGQLNVEQLEKEQPTAYSSLLASIGSAYIEQQQYEDGFQFLCEAQRVKPSEPSHTKNLEVAAGILKSKGIEPTCQQVEPEEDSEPIQEIWPQMEPDDSDE